MPLPIAEILPEILARLALRPNLVLQAPPGAGKSTMVPLALLDASWRGDGRIIMLEPRRLAARAVARRMAALRGERAGETVGYRVRLDSRIGPRTRIEVVTDGVFTRMIQNDPGLEGVAAVLFDEFHERRLETDLGLALALEAQAALHPALRLVVMSATLDAGPVASLMGEAPVVTAYGRAFPVEKRHRPAGQVAVVVTEALSEPGDILVFLPGAREIRQVQRDLAGMPPGVEVHPLAGDLDGAAQDRALKPAAEGRRKIILATSIAETSLTIEGVRQVVDSGLSRYSRYDPRTGMARLETGPVTQAAAEQRAGRAGRAGPGICWRLWPEAAHKALAPQPLPDIALTDLSALALELAAWGVADPAALRLLTPPPASAFAAARGLLRELGALESDGRISAHGRRMATLGLPPRLAHMVLAAAGEGEGTLACAIAALLTEREEGGSRTLDLRTRLEALSGRGAEAARRIARQAGIPWGGLTPAHAGRSLARAFPDRIAQRRPDAGRYLLSGGQGAILDPVDPLAAETLLAVADLDGKSPDARIRLAAPLAAAELEQVLADRITLERRVWYDPARQSVQARRQTRLGALVLGEAPLKDPDPEAVREALTDGLRRAGVSALPWTDAALALRGRAAFLCGQDGGEAWPDLSDEALLDQLAPALTGLSDFRRLDLAAALAVLLTPLQRRALETRAPPSWIVPSGSRRPIDYSTGVPVMQVRLQEMFGATAHPAVDGGRVAVTLELLSPAGRPIQITKDIGGFWTGSYKAVRAELRGRYPKHPWPEDPLTAPPTARAKPRGVNRT